MLGEDFSVDTEIAKAFIGWGIPVLALALLSFIGPIADFAWSEVLRTWRGLVILASFVVSFFVAPSLCGWVAFAVFGAFLLKRLLTYYYGQSFKKVGYMPVLFSGFYHAKANGKLERTGNSIIVEAKFLTRINQLMEDHRVQESLPLKVLPFKPPKAIHSRYNFESFEQLARRYAANSLAVMWGLIDGDGRIKSFELTTFEERFAGGALALRLMRDVGRVSHLQGVHADVVVDFLASAYAALWGHSFCHILNASGKWKDSYLIAANSRRLFERALAELEEGVGDQGDAIIEFERKRLLPLFIAQEAINLRHGEQWDEAVGKLSEAIKVNPLWPCYDSQEFTEFYNHRYAWELSLTYEHEIADDGADEGFLKKGVLSETAASASKRAWLEEPPILQLLFNYLTQAPERVKNLREVIDNNFKSLLEAHPANCFIYLYWADAVKIPKRLRGKNRGDTLPLNILDRSIKLCEEAYKLCPNLSIIPAKLSGLYMGSLSHFAEITPEFKRRFNKAVSNLGKGKLFYTETLAGEGEEPLPPEATKE